MPRDLLISVLELTLRAVPAAAVQPPLDAMAAMMSRRHPRVFERLAPWVGARFLIVPTGAGRGFLLELRPPPRPPLLRIVDPRLPHAAIATVTGSLPLLCDLFEGRIDADATFFGRRLRFEGDTSAILALRNATDGEEIDVLADLIESLPVVLRPPLAVADRLARPLADALRTARSLFSG